MSPAEPRPLDPLVALLLPAVIHRLGNATQLLTGLNAMLGLGDAEAEAAVAERSEDLARAGQQCGRVGYAMAVLGSAQGGELLLARREARGLEWLVDFLAEALRRAGQPLPDPGAPLPDLDPAGLAGWQAPWAVGRMLLAAAAGGSRQVSAWTLAPLGERALYGLELDAPPEDHLRQLHQRFGELELGVGYERLSPERGRFLLPASWFQAAPRSGAGGA